MKMGKQILLLAVTLLLAVAAAVLLIWLGRSASNTGTPEDTQPIPQDEQIRLQEQEGTIDKKDPGDLEPTGEEDPPEDELLYQSLGNGTCCVLGPGGVRDACLVIPKISPAGERVAKIASKAFFGCEWITAVQIPETVREIGTLAFADCKNLVYISVNEQNPVYCDADGVLYTADQRVLLQYPPQRAGDPLALPASVSTISEMAFYGCKNLKSVNYEGSGEDWEHIEIGSRNYALLAAAIRFDVTSE